MFSNMDFENEGERAPEMGLCAKTSAQKSSLGLAPVVLNRHNISKRSSMQAGIGVVEY